MSRPPVNGTGGRPASAEEVQTIRRWLWAAGIWAVAASIIALVALLQQEDAKPEPALGITTRVAALERKLEARLEDLEKTVEDTAGERDVTRLERRVARAEDGSADAVEAVEKLNTSVENLVERLDALESRVEDLESAPGDDGAGGDPGN